MDRQIKLDEHLDQVKFSIDILTKSGLARHTATVGDHMVQTKEQKF